MAPAAGGGMKRFYQQRKKGGVAKNKAKASKHKPQQDCGRGGEEEGEGEDELLLRRFDMDMAYGPCIGITRLRRWERAAAMGLCPPPRIRELLVLPPPLPPSSSSSSSPSCSKNISTDRNSSSSSSLKQECIWAGKV